MLLETLEAENFRNLSGKINFVPGRNVLVGDNGQGKTNWLEAVHLLATTKSFKTAKLNETIRFGEELGLVRGRIRRSEEIHRELQVAIDKNIKILSVNGKRNSASQYLGQLHTVLFNSESLEIVRGTPENRRSFLDDVIVSLHPPYVQTLSDLARVIRQKNALLRKAREKEWTTAATAEMLQPWNEQLVLHGEKIHRSRVRVVERLNEKLDQRIFSREVVTIRYASSLEEKGDLDNYRELLAERLEKRVQAELMNGHALIGPHRDDLEIAFDGHDLRKYGSSGQQRTALLLLQLANMEVYRTVQDEYPLFLIDDIDAELDTYRIRQLLEFLDGKTQTFITTSKRDLADVIVGSGKMFAVSEGAAGEVNERP